MLPQGTSANDTEGEDSDLPTTPWLQPLQPLEDEKRSGEDWSWHSLGGVAYSGQHMLDTNGGVWEEPPLSSGGLSQEAGDRNEADSHGNSCSDNGDSGAEISSSPTAANSPSPTNMATRKAALLQPRSMDSLSAISEADKERKRWLTDERRSRSYDHIFGFFKTGRSSSRAAASSGDNVNGSTPAPDTAAAQNPDTSGRSMRFDLDVSGRSVRSTVSANSETEGGIYLITREHSTSSGDIERSASPRPSALSFLSKIKSSLALLPSFPFSRPRSSDDGPQGAAALSQDGTVGGRPSSYPDPDVRRGHSLDQAKRGGEAVEEAAEGVRSPGGTLQASKRTDVRGRSLDLRPPALLDVSADVLRKASAEVERRRASMQRASGSPQGVWHTAPNLGRSEPPALPTATPKASNLMSGSLTAGRHGSMESRNSSGTLRLLNRQSRDLPTSQSWAPQTPRMLDMGSSMRARMSLDVVRRAYVQSRENNLLSSYETVLTPTAEETPRNSFIMRRSQQFTSPSASLSPKPPSMSSRPSLTALITGDERSSGQAHQYKPRIRDGSVPFHPNDATRMLWDALMFVCTVFALIVDPISLAFVGEIGRLSFLNISDRFVTAVFMLDIIANFLTGHVDKKEMKVIMHWRVVAVQYAKFWLWIDFVSSLPPEAFAAIAGSDFTDNNNLLRGARISKILRCFKVSRLAQLVEKFQLNFDIRISHFAWKISAWACACFLYLHWTTCAECWVWVFADAEKREIDLGQYGDMVGGEEDCLSFSLCNARYYLRGLRTAIAFMCGHGQETGQSLPEDIIAVVCSLMGSILYSSFIAVAISLLMEMDAERVQYMGKVERLNHYMGRRKVPLALRRRVREYMETTWRQGGGDDLEVLGFVSRSLRREMVMHNFQDVLENIPFFKSGTPGFYACLGSLLRPESFMKGEKIMIKGEVGQEMFILERGFVRLVAEGYEEEAVMDLMAEDGDDLGALDGLLTPGAYFGEVALVEKTLRTATIVAATAGTVLVLDRDAFEDRIVRYFPDIAREVQKSAREIIREHNNRRSIEMTNTRPGPFVPEAVGGGPDDVNSGLIPGRPFALGIFGGSRRLSDVHEEPGPAVGEDEADHSINGTSINSKAAGDGSSFRGQLEDGATMQRVDSMSRGKGGAVPPALVEIPCDLRSPKDAEERMSELETKKIEEAQEVFNSFGDGDLLEKPARRNPEPGVGPAAAAAGGGRGRSPTPAPYSGHASPVSVSKSVSRSGSHRSRKNSQESILRSRKSAEAAGADHIFEQLQLGETQKEEILDMLEAFGNGDLVEKPRGRTLETSASFTRTRSGSAESEVSSAKKRSLSKKGTVVPMI